MDTRTTLITAIMNVLIWVESNNNPSAVGDNGKAIGILQIHKDCVEDINDTYYTVLMHEDMLSEKLSKEIFVLYLKHGWRVFKKKHHHDPSEEDLVRMWNGGIYKGYSNPATEKYYKKYLITKNSLNNEN